MKSYLEYFNAKATQVTKVLEEGLLMALMVRVKPDTPMWCNLQKQKYLDIEDFYRCAEKYVRIDNTKENLGKGRTKGSSQNDSSKQRRNEWVAIITNQGDKKQ